MTSTHFEIRFTGSDGRPVPFTEGLGVGVGDGLRYSNLRSANSGLRRAEKPNERELIPRGGRLSVFRVTEEELDRDEEPRARLGPVASAEELEGELP